MGFLDWLKSKKKKQEIRSTMFPKPVRDIGYVPSGKHSDDYVSPDNTSNDLLTGIVIGEMLSNATTSIDTPAGNSDTFSGFGGGDFGGGGSGGSFDDTSSSSSSDSSSYDSGSSYDSSSSDSSSSNSDW